MKPGIIRISILITIISYLNCSFSHSQESIPYTISYHGTKQGLPQNQVLDIIEGNKGMIIATSSGIVMYNGNSFFPFIANQEYKKEIQYKLFYDKDSDNLYGWAQNGNYNQIHPVFRQLGVYTCISSNRDSITGIQPDGIIRTFSYDTEKIYRTLETGIENAVSLLLHGDYYYVADEKYLYKINWETGEKQILLNGRFEVLENNPYNNEVCAINGDLFCIGTNNMYHIPVVDSPTTPFQFRDIEFLSSGEFLISSSVGLYHVKDKVSRLYTIDDGLTSTSLYGIFYYKAENCVFAGTENKGLISMINKKIKTYYTEIQSGSQSFTSVIKDKTGGVYSAASKGSIVRIKNGLQEKYLFANVHLASLSYIDEKIYAGSWGEGVLIYKERKLINSLKPPVLPSLHIRSIIKDSRENIWMGTSKGIVKKSPGGEYETILITKADIMSIYELRNGNLCFGTTDGMFILNKEGKLVQRIDEKEGLICKEVRTFYEDEYGYLWIGTYGGGLYLYHNNRLISINSKPNCQLNQDVFTLAKYDGRIYMSSNQGIWSVSEKKLRDFYHGKITYLIPAYYGEELGILNTEFNGGFQNNYLQLSNKLYFPSIQGLVELLLGEDVPYRKLIPYFKSIIVNDTLLPGSSTFDRSTHTIQFDFYCPSFVQQYNVHYQYKIIGEGLPDTWSTPQKSNSVTLKMLPPGNYTFSVRGIDSFNEADPKVLSYNFTIKPFFYETRWFRGILILFSAIGIVLLVRYRIRKESEKNRISNTILELKLNAIHSKMNPHFMFNALNNIIYLLTIEKYAEAEQLLQDFSLLLRRYLEKNDSSFILLQEELDIIELYLSIQQKRYNNQFEYIINCPLELRNNVIPSMLIQPFVENAIIHGIAHSNEKGVLSIDIQKTGDQIEVRIDDNGIGRERSGKINEKRSNHKSKGITLIQEKIRVMEQKYMIKVRWEITDIKEEGKTGTSILLKIPINDKMFDS